MSTWYSAVGAILTEDGRILKTENYDSIIVESHLVAPWTKTDKVVTPTWDSTRASVGKWLCENINIKCEDINYKCEDMSGNT